MRYRLADPIIDEDQISKLADVLRSKMLVHGEQCVNFENELGNYLNINGEQVAVVSSCTAALHLALISLDIGPGAGVLVPNFTFPATVNVIERLGATPIFVDVSLDSYMIEPCRVRETITEWESRIDIKAIIVVHEFGGVVDMDEINIIAKEKNLFVVEDAACGFGSTYKGKPVGLLSDVGCYSFHPRKAITTGEGGAIVSNSKKIIERVKRLRNHGIVLNDLGVDFVEPGLNYRMTNFQAVLGTAQLSMFDSWIEKRCELQNKYREYLVHELIKLPQNQIGHSWQSFMVVLDNSVDRKKVIEKLKLLDIESNFGAHCVLDTTYYKQKYGALYPVSKMNSHTLYFQGLSLPLHQNLEVDDIKLISKKVMMVLEDGGIFK